MIARLSEIIASRLLANRNTIDPLPGDQEKIDSMGMAAFLRQRILQFFGLAA